MATTKIQRVKPLTIRDARRRWMMAYGTDEQSLAGQEIVTTSDQKRLWRGDGTMLSGGVDHGTVATEAALATIYLLPSCTRGVWPGDTAWVTSAGCEYRCISGSNATAVWRAVGAGTSAGTTATFSGLTGAPGDNAALAAVLGGKQPVSDTLSALAALTTTETGRSLLTVADLAALRSTLALAIADVSGLATALGAKAPLASPELTGSPTAPTPTTSSGIATKGYVDAHSGGSGGSGGSVSAVLLSRAATLPITASPWYLMIPWTSLDYDSSSGALWTAANPTRLLAPTAGLYRLTAWVHGTNGENWAAFAMINNATILMWQGMLYDSVSAFGTTAYPYSLVVVLSAGDYVEFGAYAVSNGTIDANAKVLFERLA